MIYLLTKVAMTPLYFSLLLVMMFVFLYILLPVVVVTGTSTSTTHIGSTTAASPCRHNPYTNENSSDIVKRKQKNVAVPHDEKHDKKSTASSNIVEDEATTTRTIAMEDDDNQSFSESELLTRIDAEPDWDTFGFGLNNVQTDSIWFDQIDTPFSEKEIKTNDNRRTRNIETLLESYMNRYSTNTKQCLQEFHSIPLHPASTILNYGQGIFEGMKAFRQKDDQIVLFRPNMNAQRMQNGANQMMLPPVSTSTFVHACEELVRNNVRWIPPYNKGSLYLRPLLFGSGPLLGVKPSTKCTFCIYASPVGNYFPKKATTGNDETDDKRSDDHNGTSQQQQSTTSSFTHSIKLQAIKGFARAAKGGSGNVKASGNYAPAFLLQYKAKQNGYDDVLFVDAHTNEYIEEAGASNFFVIFHSTKTIKTPTIRNGTILPGITRDSIIQLAQAECGYTVIDTEQLSLSEIVDADEAFCCGTGASITPVQSITIVDQTNRDDDDTRNEEESPTSIHFPNPPGPITKQLYTLLQDIQFGNDPLLNEKYKDWIHVVTIKK